MSTDASRATLLLLLLFTIALAEGLVFEKCPLARALDRAQIPRSMISNWVCLIMAESGADTAKVTDLENQSKSYGIFQINSKEGCRPGRKGGKCNTKCEDLVLDDIADAIECAKLIHKDAGFGAWKGWVSKCKLKTLPDVSMCWK